MATMLNRKEAKTAKGKDAIDEIKDFMMLKGQARFCQFFLHKYQLNPSYDNTPDLLKTATWDKKESYLHNLVEEALRDLLPYFRECTVDNPQLDDHPLQNGRRSFLKESLKPQEWTPELNTETLSASAEQTSPLNDEQQKFTHQTFTHTDHGYQCLSCGFESGYKAVTLNHVKRCQQLSNIEIETTQQEESDENLNEDWYWNYKNCEFFMDAIFSICHVFERFGDGLGFYIVNKIMMPVFHGLKHSNYSNSIHR